MKRSKIKHSRSNQVFYIFNTIFWIIFMFLIIYPLYLVCIASVSDPDAIVAGKVIWHPVDFSLIGYKAVLEYTEFWSSYRNSFIYTISSVVISIIVTLTAAYSLSRPKFPGKAAINMFFVITMFFNGGLIPTFLVMKDIGMYNNPLVMILMGCVSVWNLMVARTFIQTNIPEELYEASALDGASHFQYFIKVVMPLSKTIIAVLAVYYGVAKWNDYFTGLVYLKDRSLYPLQTVLREILATLQVDMTGDFMTTMSEDASNLAEATRIANVSKYCIIVLATGPVVVLYAFMQKYFEKGVMIGSLKGFAAGKYQRRKDRIRKSKNKKGKQEEFKMRRKMYATAMTAMLVTGTLMGLAVPAAERDGVTLHGDSTYDSIEKITDEDLTLKIMLAIRDGDTIKAPEELAAVQDLEAST